VTIYQLMLILIRWRDKTGLIASLHSFDVIVPVAYPYRVNELKKVGDLPQAQQKILFTVLRMNKPAFLTSEVHKKVSDEMAGRSVGAVLGSLYRNGYLEKVQGGRDKRWVLSKQAEAVRDKIKQQISDVKVYWS